MTPADRIDAARLAKATRLARALRQCHVSPADAALLDQAMRDRLAKTVGVSKPSPTTWLLTLGLLVSHEADVETGTQLLEAM